MDFSSFFDRLNDISSQEDLIGTGKDASSLKIEFEDAVLEAERLDLIAFLAAQEEGNKIEKFDFKTIKEEFYRIGF